MISSRKYINFIKFSNLHNWSVSYLLNNQFLYNDDFVLVEVGSFLKKSRELVAIENGKEYKRVTVKINNGGVLLRDIEFGENIGTKVQFRVKKGQFIISKIDARNGAMGVITDEVDGAVVTNDFPVFDVDQNKILTQFLVLITTTKNFIEFAQSCSSGTTNRQRIDLNKFLNVKIPLPPIKGSDPSEITQLRLVEEYNKRILEAKNISTQIEDLEKEINNYFSNELGIETETSNEASSGIYFIRFKELERWDVWASRSQLRSSKHEIKTFGSIVIGKPTYGANVKGVNIEKDVRYIRITDINEDGTLNDNKVYPDIVDEKYLLKEDDFLIARSGNTVGKSFLYKEKYGKAIYAGYLIKYKLDKSSVIPEYVLEFTKSSIFKRWIQSNQRVSAQPNINGQEFLLAPMIIPSKVIQMKIIETIRKMRLEIKELNKKAQKLNEIAIVDFEKAIFKYQ